MENDNLSREEVEVRAYEIYLKRGGEDGRAAEDWLIAEEELRQERAEAPAPLKSKAVATSQRREA